jgi:hypothetical protein
MGNSKLLINLEGRDIGEFSVVDSLPGTIVARNQKGILAYFSKVCAQIQDGITYVGPFTDNQMREKFGQVNPFETCLRTPYKLVGGLV